jgi:hypothetical protein
VIHILSHNAHFWRVPFLWTPITNNKTYQTENLKLIIHYKLDYENIYVIFFNINETTFHKGFLKYKNMD